MSALFRRRKLPSTGKIVLHVGDAAYDEWPIVGDYEQLDIAMAFCQQLRESGFAAEITSDWPLDQWGGGDIALRTHPEEDQFAARELIEFEDD
ncbi:MAG: hypothetical protein HYX29_05955 [Solirubrobacterales bacterium]|nr:hypothetical protein [Solirubrobacterales bacterium]